MENVVGTICCRVDKSHEERERLISSKITDYIRKQSNHKEHLRAHEWMTFEKCFASVLYIYSLLLPDSYRRPDIFFHLLPRVPPCILKTVFYWKKKKMQCTLMYVWCVTSACFFPTLSSTKAINRHCALVFKFQKTSCDESCVYMCLWAWMCACMKMPGTFRHVFIGANSSSEAPQLWWAGG